MFSVGDSVRLRIGSPAMSIFALHDDVCTCQWFAGTELKSGYFNFSQLQSEDEFRRELEDVKPQKDYNPYA